MDWKLPWAQWISGGYLTRLSLLFQQLTRFRVPDPLPSLGNLQLHFLLQSPSAVSWKACQWPVSEWATPCIYVRGWVDGRGVSTRRTALSFRHSGGMTEVRWSQALRTAIRTFGVDHPRMPSSQAGRRGFESRLPLHNTFIICALGAITRYRKSCP